MTPETTPKAMLRRCAPILFAKDLLASVAYWRDRCGFDRVEVYNDPPDFAILSRDSVTIMLALAPEGHEVTPHWKIHDKMWNAYVWVDDARALYEEFQASGAQIDYTLHEKPYGCLEFGIQDLDGHDIAFGQVL